MHALNLHYLWHLIDKIEILFLRFSKQNKAQVGFLLPGMKRVLEYRGFLVPARMTRIIWLGGFSAIIMSGLCFGLLAQAAVTDDVNKKYSEIDAIQREIEQYQQQIDAIQPTKVTLQSEVSKLNAKINQLNLEIKSLGLSIAKTNSEVQSTQEKIKEAEVEIAKNQVILGQYLRILYQNDQETLTTVLLKHEALSDFFTDLNSIKTTQDELRVVIDGIQALKVSLEEKGQELEDKRTDLEKQKGLEEINKRSVDQNKAQKDKLLKETKGQESKFQTLVSQSQSKIEKIKAEIFYLQQNGVTADDAVKFGNLAAIATGIRPAFLIAELELESGLGRNVGKCNRAGDPPSKGYRVIMKPTRDIQPFLKITSELGMDPETTAVSCPIGNGWGGAMGPAQFIPSTWMGYKDEVARITGRPLANPWNIEDAFIAAAAKLSRGGANSKTRAGEIAASKAYYCGNSKSTRADCVNYANKVQALSNRIEQNL